MDGPGSLPYGDDGNGCTWADLASPIYGGGGEVVDDGITVVDDGITCDFLLKLLRAGSMVGADAALLHELESRAAVVSLCRLRALGSKNRDDDPDGVASTSSLEDEAVHNHYQTTKAGCIFLKTTIREDVRTACVYVESLTKELVFTTKDVTQLLVKGITANIILLI
uniref:Uncharacterized protein n=1 Tax=Oryza sativa subsp. japonica TaxID=39947 RepID=Q2QY77_ORYSJ|nr:hypothetical protein LOC_Os12g03580 [Oryza sativa Japonica Group]